MPSWVASFILLIPRIWGGGYQGHMVYILQNLSFLISSWYLLFISVNQWHFRHQLFHLQPCSSLRLLPRCPHSTLPYTYSRTASVLYLSFHIVPLRLTPFLQHCRSPRWSASSPLLMKNNPTKEKMFLSFLGS